MSLGFSDAAISVWPFPDDLFGVVAGGTDFDYILELAQQRYNKDPNNLEKLSNLAWAHWNAGNSDMAVELGTRYLEKLPPERRMFDFTNMILAFQAGISGDDETMRQLLEPLDGFLNQLLASGVDNGDIRAGKAWISFMLGQEAPALENMQKAMFSNLFSVEGLAVWYERAGWDQLPDWRGLQERHREYMEAESAKLLAIACGPDGFEAWQPSDEECGRKRSTGPI